MDERKSLVTLVLIGTVGLLMCISLAAAQTDVTTPGNEKQEDVINQDASAAPTIDPVADAQFETRIAQIQQEAQARIQELQSSIQSGTDVNSEAIQSQISDVKKESQISILEIRHEQYVARGDAEMAEKFQRAADMLRNPVARQAADPAADQARSEQVRSTQQPTTR